MPRLRFGPPPVRPRGATQGVDDGIPDLPELIRQPTELRRPIDKGVFSLHLECAAQLSQLHLGAAMHVEMALRSLAAGPCTATDDELAAGGGGGAQCEQGEGVED